MNERTEPVNGKQSSADDFPETAQAQRLTDSQNYLMSWLVASETQLRTFDIDGDKRFETVISTLHRERSRNILPFKPRTRK